jgi:hypothetical protein
MSSYTRNHMGLQKLLTEPDRLAAEAEEVNGELERLVIDNYRVFIENLTCNVHLQSEVSRVIYDCIFHLFSGDDRFRRKCCRMYRPI